MFKAYCLVGYAVHIELLSFGAIDSIPAVSEFAEKQKPERNHSSHTYRNVVWDISAHSPGLVDRYNRRMQYAWFPMESGKERFRRWCISRSNVPAKEFNQTM